jgi:VanZ family protein
MKKKRIVAALLIGALLAAVVFAPLSARTHGIRTLHDFAHAPIFGSISLLLLFAIGSHEKLKQLPLWTQYLGAFVIAGALGALTEIAQIPVGRDASWMDLRSDMLGAGGFLGLFTAFDARLRRRAIITICAVAGTGLLAIHSVPLATAVNAYVHRERAFPVLADFKQRIDPYFIKSQWAALDLMPLPKPWAARPGELAMRVTFATGPWPGVDFPEPSPDWSGYRTLALDITNPAATELMLRLRVHDVYHDNRVEDRFNRTLQIPPMTRTVLRIPIADIQSAPQTRSMDLRQIADYLLFRSSESQVGEMYVAGVWLEGGE